MEKKAIKDLKRGDLFKREINGQPGAKVYIKGSYDRASGTYSAIAYDDINNEIFLKPNKAVYIGFTF